MIINTHDNGIFNNYNTHETHCHTKSVNNDDYNQCNDYDHKVINNY